MSDEDLKELQTLLVHSPFCLDSFVIISSPFTTETTDGLIKCIGKGGRIAAYAPTFETAIARLCLELLRDENPLLRWNR